MFSPVANKFSALGFNREYKDPDSGHLFDKYGLSRTDSVLVFNPLIAKISPKPIIFK